MCQCFCLKSPSKLDPSFSTSRKTPTDHSLICSSWEVKAYGTLWPISVASSPRIAQESYKPLLYFLWAFLSWSDAGLRAWTRLEEKASFADTTWLTHDGDNGHQGPIKDGERWIEAHCSEGQGTLFAWFDMSPRWCTKDPGAIIRDVGISSCELGGSLDDGWEEVKKVGVIPNSLVMAVSGLSGWVNRLKWAVTKPVCWGYTLTRKPIEKEHVCFERLLYHYIIHSYGYNDIRGIPSCGPSLGSHSWPTSTMRLDRVFSLLKWIPLHGNLSSLFPYWRKRICFPAMEVSVIEGECCWLRLVQSQRCIFKSFGVQWCT